VNLDRNFLDWLRLYATKSVGQVTFRRLLAEFKTASEAIKALPEVAAKAGRSKSFEVPSLDWAEKYCQKCQKFGVELIPFYENDYPRALKVVEGAPMLLHAKGRLELLKQKSLAVVGSRTASLQGIAFAKKLTKELSDSRFVIVSGLARGIDTAAHLAALEGGTIAVVGNGLDVFYPPENKELQEKIVQNGLIIGEPFLGREPVAQTFHYRNRLISGLSLGVLVVEAAMKSGSLLTAEYAVEQSKDVFAVPGHPYDPRARGTNFLIKNGANLIENAQNIVDFYQNFDYQQRLFEIQEVNEEKLGYFSGDYDETAAEEVVEFLKENLGAAVLPVSEVVKNSNYSTAQILAALCELELAGIIEFENMTVRKVAI